MTRPFAGACYQLRVNQIKQILKGPPSSGTLSWGDKRSIDFKKTEDNYLIIKYSTSVDGASFVKVEEKISIELMPLTRGGHQAFMHDPECARRVSVLYQHGLRFLCHKCHNITWQSSKMQRYERLNQSGDKYARKLGLDFCWH
jgi:hypothetical protein